MKSLIQRVYDEAIPLADNGLPNLKPLVQPKYYCISGELYAALGDFLELQETQQVNYAELFTFGKSLCSVN